MPFGSQSTLAIFPRFAQTRFAVMPALPAVGPRRQRDVGEEEEKKSHGRKDGLPLATSWQSLSSKTSSPLHALTDPRTPPSQVCYPRRTDTLARVAPRTGAGGLQSRHERGGWPRAHWPAGDREERSGPARLNTGDRIRRSHWRPAILPGSSFLRPRLRSRAARGPGRTKLLATRLCGGAGVLLTARRDARRPRNRTTSPESVKLPSRRVPETRTLLHQSHLPSPA